MENVLKTSGKTWHVIAVYNILYMHVDWYTCQGWETLYRTNNVHFLQKLVNEVIICDILLFYTVITICIYNV